MLKLATGISAGLCALAMAGSAFAASASLTTTDDGFVAPFVGLDTTSDRVGADAITSPGGLLTLVGLLEFDLGAIPDAATIDGASLDVVLTSEIRGPVSIQIIGFAGDGTVTSGDVGAVGTTVFDAVLPAGGAEGDPFSFTLSGLSFFQSLLPTDLLTLRLESNVDGGLYFASLENADHPAAALNVDYSVGSVPLPAALPMLAVGLAGLGLFRRRG